MADVNLFRILVKVMKLNIRKGYRVLIVTDYKMDRVIYDAIVMAVFAQDAIPMLLVIPPVEFGEEPPEVVAKAVTECDLIVAVCSRSISHTDTMRRALKTGVRYFQMGGATIDSLTKGAATADPDYVIRLGQKLADIVTKGSRVEVTSREGTDLRFSIEGRSGVALTPVIDERIGKVGFPEGEVYTSALEGTAEGTLVVDGSVHMLGKLENPIRLTVNKGMVVRIEGKDEAERLSRILKELGDASSYNIGEFAMGTNPAATLADNVQESKKMAGTIHFALGDNITIGGTVASKLHLDSMVKRPTVKIDGVTIIEDGKMLVTI